MSQLLIVVLQFSLQASLHVSPQKPGLHSVHAPVNKLQSVLLHPDGQAVSHVFPQNPLSHNEHVSFMKQFLEYETLHFGGQSLLQSPPVLPI